VATKVGSNAAVAFSERRAHRIPASRGVSESMEKDRGRRRHSPRS
jgi:hypothetical protein